VTSSTPEALWRAPALRALHPSAISCTDLVRGRLLDRCSLAVPVGMRLLLVGQPEASASMLVRILAGLSRPRRGRIEIAGLTGGWGRRVAYVGPQPGIYAWMTPREALHLAARLLALPAHDAARRIERALAWVRIPADLADRPVGAGGPPLLQRTGLAAALLADPEVLLLDEPLRALAGDERTNLLGLPGQRRTVVLASSDPASEAGLATHVSLIRDGKVALLASLRDLQAAGQPLSMRGILALADARSTGAAERASAAAW
jgi:ABC-type multidrug transport system ATPase subunit